MALTLGDLSLHVVGKTPQDLSERERDTLADLLSWCNAEIYAYIGTDSMIPEEIRDAAIRRIAYYDYHSRLSRQPPGETLQVRFRRTRTIAHARVRRAQSSQSIQAPAHRSGPMIELGIAGGPPVEKHSYTSLHVAAAEAYAEHGLYGAATGAVEIAARMYQAAFHVASVEAGGTGAQSGRARWHRAQDDHQRRILPLDRHR